MFPLDPRTIERIARLAVDDGGPYHRTGRELEQLLRHAGWQNLDPYDGSPRVPWLIMQIEEQIGQRENIEKLLCRICDPREYDDGAEGATQFRQNINQILQHEDIEIVEIAGRPVVAELDHEGSPSTHAEPRDLDTRVCRLVRDQGSADVLLSRLAEARICNHGGAYTMAVIAIGSFIEGLLYTILTERNEDARNGSFVGWTRNPKRDPEENGPSMFVLINTAHKLGWIQFDAMKFAQAVREFRNFIHPRFELLKLPAFDAESVGLCWAPLHAMLNDLEQQFP